MTTWTARRRIAHVAVAGATVSCLASCGSHHHKAPPTTTSTSTSSTTTVPPTTTTVKAQAVAPLLGLPQTNAAQLNAPAVVVKIDNVAQALPQTGLNQADIVYEEMVEGGLTRLAAVFQSQYPSVVGPVRSGRLTDEGIADDLSHPVYAFAGTNANFYPILDAQPVTSVNPDDQPSLFYRVGNNAPHNEFADVVKLAAVSTTHYAPKPLYSYLAAGAPFAGSGMGPAGPISLDFPAASVVWNWNAADGAWLRTQDGAADKLSNGQQVEATNIVVLVINYISSGTATGEGVPPTEIPEGIQVGTGTGWVLSEGRVVKVTWTRPSLTSPAVLKDAQGNQVSLARGRTWVELLPNTQPVPAFTP